MYDEHTMTYFPPGKISLISLKTGKSMDFLPMSDVIENTDTIVRYVGASYVNGPWIEALIRNKK